MFDQLPIERLPFDDESGLGYCLRCVSTSGFNLHWLRRNTGINEKTSLCKGEIPKIAGAIQGSVEWLGTNLPQQLDSAKGKIWQVAGHTITTRNKLRGSWPQLCHLCVGRQGYCRQEWDFSLCTVCITHKVPLLDRCSFCMALMRWDRPGLGTCNCGRLFGASRYESTNAMGSAMIVAKMIRAWLERCCPSHLLKQAKLPNFLGSLSLDGLLSIIHAFGTLEHEFSVNLSSCEIKMASRLHWEIVASRAIYRLRCWNSGNQILGLVNLAVLHGLATRATMDADRGIALSLLRTVRGQGAPSPVQRSKQLSLF